MKIPRVGKSSREGLPSLSHPHILGLHPSTQETLTVFAVYIYIYIIYKYLFICLSPTFTHFSMH